MPSLSTRQHENPIRDELRNRSIDVAGMPYYYHVHLHMPCNQRCIMCVPDGRHPGSSLPFSEFQSLYETIEPFAEHITLIGGEPLLYPRIGDVIALLAQREIAVTINTNATALFGDLAASLATLHELHLKCSIDAAHRTPYHRIRGTDVFDRVLANIRAFCERTAGHPRMHVIPVFVVMRENLDEVLPFVDLFGSLSVERIEFHPVRHVSDWVVENRTGWTFRGADQVCESFAERYNDTMRAALARGNELGTEIEVHLLPESADDSSISARSD